MAKFLCDQMLGSLARWLRFLGFDTFYANNEISDNELLDISDKENRILITRDKELIIRANKRNISNIRVESTDLDTQIIKVLNISKSDFIDKNILTRCSECNSLIYEIKKEDVEDLIPKKVFDNKNLFWKCKKCDTIYWKGSHYDKIISRINLIKQKI